MIFKGDGFYLTDYAKKDNKKQKLEKNESKKGNNNESSNINCFFRVVYFIKIRSYMGDFVTLKLIKQNN